jgi:hypothetical protein
MNENENSIINKDEKNDHEESNELSKIVGESEFDNISEHQTLKFCKSKSSVDEFNETPKKEKHVDYKKRRKTKGRIMLKNFKKKKSSNRMTLAALASKEKDQMSMEVRSIFKSDSLMTNNIKSLQKEKKINDTIVALISFIIIILCFFQMYLLIDENYNLTDKILTIRSCMLILSIPNCNLIYIIN